MVLKFSLNGLQSSKSMLNKKAVFASVQKEIQQRIATIQAAFDDLNAAVTSDTKSSAGDKHETGIAMAQLEQEKLSQQLANALELRSTLAQINPEAMHTTVQFGSLVQTSNGAFFISVGIGNIGKGGEILFCISAATPMGKILLGKKQGDSIEFNGNLIQIEQIQ